MGYHAMDRETIPDWAVEDQAAYRADARVRYSRLTRHRNFGTSGRVVLFPRGALLEAEQVAKTRTSGNTGKRRGRIAGWSPASRRRMRLWLLEHAAVGDVLEACVTLTVPGPNLTPEEVRDVWRRMTVYLPRIGVSCVWRLEVQERGAAHWHCLMHRSRSYRHPQVKTLPEEALDVQRDLFLLDVRRNWAAALDSLGECVHQTARCEYRAVRSALPGAFEPIDGKPYGVAVDFDHVDKASVGWIRYMLDHASKAKQSQEAQGLGRHWGVIGQKAYEANEVESVANLGRRAYVGLLRVLRKWNRMRIRVKDGCRSDVWGTKLGYETGRGRRGSSVWFGNPAVFERARDYARAL